MTPRTPAYLADRKVAGGVDAAGADTRDAENPAPRSNTEPWLDDGDVRIHVGDVRAVLAELPDESVDCCVTSPPYLGLRDYGHDDQIGLEGTVGEYVQTMVAVFREVRRVLAPHGTCWLNLGDSYGGGALGRNDAGRNFTGGGGNIEGSGNPGRQGAVDIQTGLKPKNLVGIPWRVAFALQADGWWLRSDIIWAKPNPMPESVTDRPTKSHEYVFLLSKRSSYWFDQEAVREPLQPASVARGEYGHGSAFKGQFNGSPVDERHQDGKQYAKLADAMNPAGRNVRSVWEIATQPFAEAHFATFPEELVRRCLLAGCPAEVCSVCAKPRERIPGERALDLSRPQARRAQELAEAAGLTEAHIDAIRAAGVTDAGKAQVTQNGTGRNTAAVALLAAEAKAALGGYHREFLLARPSAGGWSDCGHADWRPGVVLDPFLGSGTTALVARKHGRHAIGIELSEDYAALAAARLQQLSLLAEAR